MSGEAAAAPAPEATTGDSMNPSDYDYDLIVIGGGSGGLALAKEAGSMGKRVAMLDYVKPSPQGTSWGLGGTCVNVGCIPKKLMHQSALIGHGMATDATQYGWNFTESPNFDWEACSNNITMHIKSLNFGYRTAVRESGAKYINAYGTLLDRHRVKHVNRRGEEAIISGMYIAIVTGGRPRVPEIPGAEFGVTSDDIFQLHRKPGKTLVVGASYVALECAGFLRGMGFDVTVMVRSILLRGFDQDMAEKIGENMKTDHGVQFVRGHVPTKMTKLDDTEDGMWRVEVTSSPSNNEGDSLTDTYNTVLFATGRDPCTRDIGLDTVGVRMDDKGFIYTENEATNVWNIFALGDVMHDKPELTPTAIQAGRLLARRLFAGSTVMCDYERVPTTVFTPMEYGCCGLTEEEAKARYGEDKVEVFHDNIVPLEYSLGRGKELGYGKVITLIPEDNRVIGFHVLSPNAGEITQGIAIAMRCGMTKAHMDASIGIHPTCAEAFTVMPITKRSGKELSVSGC